MQGTHFEEDLPSKPQWEYIVRTVHMYMKLKLSVLSPTPTGLGQRRDTLIPSRMGMVKEFWSEQMKAAKETIQTKTNYNINLIILNDTRSKNFELH